MAKRVREFQSVSFEQQLKAFKPLRVNPFSLMMEAARTAAHQDADSRQGAGAHAQQQQQQQQRQQQQHVHNSRQHHAGAQHRPGCYVPCTHCGCGLSELSVQQCHSCKNVYCSSCSVINYDAREDRVFCLDCLPGAAVTCCSRDDDDFEMHDQVDQFDQSTFDQFDRPSFDMYRSASPGRDITGCGQPSSSSGRSSSLMQACNRAAAAVAASAAANGSTPFGSMMGSLTEQGCNSLLGATGMSSAPSAAAAPWDTGGNGSPSTLAGPGRPSGQLLATSPVIPFVGLGCGQGYMGLASRVCGAAV